MKNLKFNSKQVNDDFVELSPADSIIKEILDKNINDVVLEDENGDVYLGQVIDGSDDPLWGPPYLWIQFK